MASSNVGMENCAPMSVAEIKHLLDGTSDWTKKIVSRFVDTIEELIGDGTFSNGNGEAEMASTFGGEHIEIRRSPNGWFLYYSSQTTAVAA